MRPLLFWALLATHGIPPRGPQHPGGCERFSSWPAESFFGKTWDPNGSLPGRSREAPGRVRTIFRDPPGKLPGSRDPPGSLRRRGRPPALLHAADSCCHRRRAAAAIPGAERRSVARDAACAGDNSRRRTPPVTRSGQLLPPATGSGRNPWR
eukprot:gene14729-biopygen6602